ncbi:MAG: 16S rRNA (uracil(1498)-N(3))-methyltransferase [Coprococcus sp.]|nr:16S rRNA (uracil(1498)-N(3))-methyltransferase [Coprococcus sp.]
MHHFFVAPSQVEETRIYIEGTDVNHMKNVLRMKNGEKLMVSDGNNRKYLCEVASYEEGRAFVNILETREADTELSSRIYLFQGLPKGDKMDLIVQKSVELGAYAVIPMETRRAVVKLDEKKAAKRIDRWNGIARSAAEQAGRAVIPRVEEVHSFQDALKRAEEMDVALIPYELCEGMDAARELIRSIRPGQSVGIFIGPEGGFEKDEVEEAVRRGAFPVTLGRRILRTETAGLAMLSILMFELEQG